MKRKTIIFMLCLCVILAFAACKKDEKQQGNPATDSNISQTTQPDDLEIDEDDSDEDDPDLVGDAGNNLEIYTIDSDTLEITPLNVASSGEDITAKEIVKAVTDNLDEPVGVAKVEEKKNKVIVTFQNGKAPLSGCSAQIEERILDCISNSLLDNLPTCEGVIFRSETGAYEGGHISLDKDEVYASK